jgi:diguanylate cyclase (GGDEF)-like protein
MPRARTGGKPSIRAKISRDAPHKRLREHPLTDANETATLAAEIERLRGALEQSEARIEELQQSAHEDALTGLLNRRGFERAFARTIAYLKRYGGSAALIYLDLDNFKPVNDKYGHAAGDVVLREISRLIASSVRASDIVARIGGDEIAVMLLNIDATQTELKARALEARAKNAGFEMSGTALDIGLSAGATMLSGDDELEAALKRADAAMYARKKERKAHRK